MCANAVAIALLDDGVLTRVETAPWLFSPSIDGVAVIVITAVVAVVVYRLLRKEADRR